MSRNWSQGDVARHEAACAAAWAGAHSTRERGEAFLTELTRAADAHEVWAVDLLSQYAQRGAQSEVKAWGRRANRPLVAVTHDGRLLTRPSVGGVTRRTGGAAFIEQELFVMMTWAELETKVRDHQRQTRAYGDNIELLTKLLGLRDLAPSAATPHDAARTLGIDLGDWLTGTG